MVVHCFPHVDRDDLVHPRLVKSATAQDPLREHPVQTLQTPSNPLKCGLHRAREHTRVQRQRDAQEEDKSLYALVSQGLPTKPHNGVRVYVDSLVVEVEEALDALKNGSLPQSAPENSAPPPDRYSVPMRDELIVLPPSATDGRSRVNLIPERRLFEAQNL